MQSNGLEGIVVAETALSHVDGAAGALVLRGHPVESLAGEVPFEGVVALFADGVLPSPARLRDVKRALGEARAAAFPLAMELVRARSLAEPMDALRAMTACLEATALPPFGLIGALATFGAAIGRSRAGEALITPDPARGHAEDLLRMLGRDGSPEQAAGLDAYLVSVVDHGMNASTFAARVVTSTESDVVSAVVAGIGALKGRLHGGAPGPVLDMLDAVGTPENAPRYVASELAQGARIMGMGHRIYRVRDPRAAVLERATRRLPRTGAIGARLALATAVEQAAEKALAAKHPDRPLRANVEFFTAVLLEAVGIPRALFTVTFACGRVVGWCAHADEQRRTGRLIRPASLYVGPTP